MSQISTNLSPGMGQTPADSGCGWSVLIVVLLVVAALGGVMGGPALGDHEAIVAACAREMRLSGDWVVPRFLETPFVRKPPLPYWAVAAASYLFPNDAQTGLPVTVAAARLPSALAALGVVLLLWRLAASMFGARCGRIAAVLGGSSLFILLYAPNATAEMLLTLGCTWAFVHFWYAATARRPGPRFGHAMLFYVALGFAMLAKGPAPVALVVFPLGVWWYAERPLRVLARLGPAGWRRVGVCFLRGLWPRTLALFTRLWVIPGVIVFLASFVPWMMAAASDYPDAWKIWNWQYVQRAGGNYEDTRVRSIVYYLPVVAGFVAPWTFLIFEGLASPWMKRYARHRRALLYTGLWAGLGIVAMSLMQFKKPYYIVPALPGLLLVSVLVAQRAFTYRFRRPRLAWTVWGVAAVGGVVAVVAGGWWLRANVPDGAGSLTWVAAGAVVLTLAAAALHLAGRGWTALGMAAVVMIATFQLIWHAWGPRIDNVGKVAALARALDAQGVPEDALLLWADQRPDARLGFYFGRRSKHLVAPFEAVSLSVDRKLGKRDLRELVLDRAEDLLSSPRPAYLIMDRKHYDLWRSIMPPRGHLEVVLDTDPNSESEDWVVVSNQANGR